MADASAHMCHTSLPLDISGDHICTWLLCGCTFSRWKIWGWALSKKLLLESCNRLFFKREVLDQQLFIPTFVVDEFCEKMLSITKWNIFECSIRAIWPNIFSAVTIGLRVYLMLIRFPNIQHTACAHKHKCHQIWISPFRHMRNMAAVPSCEAFFQPSSRPYLACSSALRLAFITFVIASYTSTSFLFDPSATFFRLASLSDAPSPESQRYFQKRGYDY